MFSNSGGVSSPAAPNGFINILPAYCAVVTQFAVGCTQQLMLEAQLVVQGALKAASVVHPADAQIAAAAQRMHRCSCLQSP